jgi:uncharacterized protein YjbI with pentapeptide repeats
MCKMASFIINHKTGKVKVYDLCGHSETYAHFKLTDTSRSEWREGHYLRSGVIECRTIDGDELTSEQLVTYVKTGWPTFKDFLQWAIKQEIGVSLDLRGCDLKGITLPTSIGGYLDLRGCDLKGITLPTSIGCSLDLSGCDLKGITLPTSIGCSLDLSGCDLKGITLTGYDVIK